MPLLLCITEPPSWLTCGLIEYLRGVSQAGARSLTASIVWFLCQGVRVSSARLLDWSACCACKQGHSV